MASPYSYGGMTREEKKGYSNFLHILIIILCIIVECGSAYRYFTGKYVDLSIFLVPALGILYSCIMLFTLNKKRALTNVRKMALWSWAR